MSTQEEHNMSTTILPVSEMFGQQRLGSEANAVADKWASWGDPDVPLCGNTDGHEHYTRRGVPCKRCKGEIVCHHHWRRCSKCMEGIMAAEAECLREEAEDLLAKAQKLAAKPTVTPHAAPAPSSPELDAVLALIVQPEPTKTAKEREREKHDAALREFFRK